MRNKLVYISGQAYWMTPEGSFIQAEIRDGIPVERFVIKHDAELTAVYC